MPKTTKTYQELRSELDDILLALQQPDADVEEAIKLYERGLKIATDLRGLLDKSQNKITKLTAGE